MHIFYTACANRKGFSLLEMILALSLSVFLIVSIIALVLSFSNAYLNLQQSEIETKSRTCYEKFIKLSLRDYKYSNVLTQELDAQLLNSGIFWETSDLHAFVEEKKQFIAGIYYRDNVLNFLWTDSDEVRVLTDQDFIKFVLFRDVRSVCLMVYNVKRGEWTTEKFNEETARYLLHKNSICYLRIKYLNSDNVSFFPMFGFW